MTTTDLLTALGVGTITYSDAVPDGVVVVVGRQALRGESFDDWARNAVRVIDTRTRSRVATVPCPTPRCGQPVPANAQPWECCLACRKPIKLITRRPAGAPVRR